MFSIISKTLLNSKFKHFSQFINSTNLNCNSFAMNNLFKCNKNSFVTFIKPKVKKEPKIKSKQNFKRNPLKGMKKKKPRVPGSQKRIHKADFFNNNLCDKTPITKASLMTKTIKILEPLKNIKQNTENEEDKSLDETSIIPVEKKEKVIRPRDLIFPNPMEAIKALKLEEDLKFKGKDQTIDFVIKLEAKQAKKGTGQIRGLVTFPGGAIRAPKLCVFTSNDMIESAKTAGADLIGDSTIVKNILDGKTIPFQKCVATTDSFSILKSVARILGPKGLMPNNKSGTLVDPKDLENTILEIKAGKKEFRINPDNTIRLSIGKRSYTDDNLLKNLDSVCNAIYDSKPDGVRNFFVWAFLFPGQGRVYRIDPQSILPVSDEYFFEEYEMSKFEAGSEEKAGVTEKKDMANWKQEKKKILNKV